MERGKGGEVRIFIAGATGAIGRRVVPRLVALGDHVTAVARSPEKRALLERQGAHPIECDLFDRRAVERAVRGHDTVINLATSIPRGAKAMLVWSWRENNRIRKEVPANLGVAAVATGVSRFIQESFAPIYPSEGSRWIDESTPLKPVKYNRTVLDAEAAAERFGRNGGTAVVLRFAFFYGPGDPYTDTLIGGVKKGWLPFPGAPQRYVSMVHHDDAAAAVVSALEIPAGVYNVVDDEPMTRRELADGLARLLKVKPPRIMPSFLLLIAGSSGEMMLRSERISNRKLKEASSWEPKWRSVVEGVAGMGSDLERT